MGLKPDDARAMGLFACIRECTCAHYPARERPCPWCRRASPETPARPAATAEASSPPPSRSQREWEEQVAVVQALEARGRTYAASLNGVHLSKTQAGKAKAAGTVAGEPDLRIYDHPLRPPTAVLARGSRWLLDLYLEAPPELGPRHPGDVAELRAVVRWLEAGAPCGVALEMKTPELARTNDPWAGCSGAQRVRLEALARLGWAVIVGYGADDALRKLDALDAPEDEL